MNVLALELVAIDAVSAVASEDLLPALKSSVFSGLSDSPVGGILLVTPGFSLVSWDWDWDFWDSLRVLRAFPVSALTLNLSLGSDLSVIFCVEPYPTSVKTLLRVEMNWNK